MTFEMAANPTPFIFDPTKTALLVIDMQVEYCSEGGYGSALGYDTSSARAIVPNVQAAIARARELGMLVIFTREGHRPNLRDIPAAVIERTRQIGADIGGQGKLGRRLTLGEPGNQIIPELDVRPEDVEINKPHKSCFYGTDLDVVLRSQGITHLMHSGVATNVCITSTIRSATDRGYWNLALEDACAAFEPRLQAAAIELITGARGAFGWVSTVDKFQEADTRSVAGSNSKLVS